MAHGPAWGHVHFGAGFLHPSSALLVCLTGIVVIQFLGFGGLGLVLLLLLSTLRQILPGWWVLLRRLRWLLLSVWAHSEALGDEPAPPTPPHPLRALVDAAVAHARAGGAARVEAYPVDYAAPVGASFLYHGTAEAFRAAGFRELARPSRTRPIFGLELSARRARPAPARARGRSTPRTRRSPRSPSPRSR